MKDNRGFSLIELIVSVALMTLIMTIITAMLTNSSRSFERQTAQVELQNEAQIIVNYLSEAIMEATDMNFTVYDDVTGAGRYELFKLDAEGKASAKGDQRYLYYMQDPMNPDPEKRYMLYMVTFNSGEVPPANPTGSDLDNMYLISNEVTEFNIDFEKSTQVEATTSAEEETAEGETSATPAVVVKNPLTVRITFKLQHNSAASEFEIEANCRNRLDDIIVTRADGSVETFEAINR